MKAISLWQPWASAIAVGAKQIETRGWETKYRGPIAIHAAKRKVVDELIHFSCCWNWCGALRPLGLKMGGNAGLGKILPFGAIVAVCDLTDCRPTDSFTLSELMSRRLPEGETLDIYSWNEWQMGDFSLGRFGWVLSNIRPLSEPIPFVGRQSIFDVPDEMIERK